MQKNIEVIDSWSLSSQGIIAELKYQGNGLPKDTRLKSILTGQQWIVTSRVLFNHVLDEQKRFSSEVENIMSLSFSTVEKMEKSGRNILMKEELGIYQYKLDPEGHSEKPERGGQLEVISYKQIL